MVGFFLFLDRIMFPYVESHLIGLGSRRMISDVSFFIGTARCLFVICNIMTIMLAIKDPGRIRKDRVEPPGPEKLSEELYELLMRTPDTSNICPDCCTLKTPRSRHCYLCNCCIERFDHHCPWINNCVGRDNHALFYAFIICQLLYLASIIFLQALCIIEMLFFEEQFDKMGQYD